jgi:NADPH:quinone reductase-like Zn-dependent oxidoreductase
MKGWTYTRYGGPEVLQFVEQEPPALSPDGVLVRVHASALNAADWHMMRADPFLARIAVGLRKPRKPMTIGSDVAGIVEAVGDRVTRIAPGDHVMAETMMMGGCAELAAVPEKIVGRTPTGMTFEQAAAIPMAGVTALTAVKHDGRLRPGQSVLVNGASGGVGTFAVQIAHALGGRVTAVCSTGAVELVRSLGAEEVIDYTKAEAIDTGRTYDLVVSIGGLYSARALRRTVARGGTLAAVGGSKHGGLLGPGGTNTRAALISPFVPQRLVSVSDKPNAADLETLAQMCEAGQITPVIDRVFPLSETPAAMRYLEDAHPKGKVIVTVAG